MIKDVDEDLVRRMTEWASSANSPEEIEARQKSLRALLLDGVEDEKEQERVSNLIEAAKFPKTEEAKEADVEPKKKRKRPLFYSPERRGYMRATNEEGLGEEMKKMREEAQGTPFFDSAPPTPAPSRAARDKIFEDLKKIAEKQK